MNLSSDATVVKGADAAAALAVANPELRAGRWTRLGERSVLGDTATEQTLDALAETTRAAAQSLGYATGWAQGQRAANTAARHESELASAALTRAESHRQAEHECALAALKQAATLLQDAVAHVCEQVEERATGLAMELTATLVGHDVARATDPGALVLRRALGLLPTEPFVRLRVHPDAAVASAVVDLAERGVSVIADATLGRCDALVESADELIDLRISTALDRVREVLS